MGYTTPPSKAAGNAWTAATWNTYVKDNIIDLDRRTTPTAAQVLTAETTTATSYTALATAGPAVTVTVGANGLAIVHLYSSIANSTTGAASYVSFAISGASTVAASDPFSLAFTSPSPGGGDRHGATFYVSGLTAGSNTFTMQYKVSANTGTFSDRKIIVVPLGA